MSGCVPTAGARAARLRRFSRSAACVVALGLAGSPALATDAELVAAAEKEGMVVWYTGLIVNQVVKPLVEAFQKKYPGITVTATYNSGTELILKLTSEARAGGPQADVIDGAGQALPTLIAANLIEAYPPKSAAAFPAKLRSKDGYWTALTVHYVTPAINTELVLPAEAPKTYQDLLDPKWKGKMAWSIDLNSAGAPGVIGNILTVMGDEAGKAYLAKLAQQKIANVAANQRVVLDQVIAGPYPLTLNAYNHHVVISQGQGAKVEWLKFEHVIEHFTVGSVVKGSPHPNAAKLFIEYLLSEEGQKVFREANYLPADPTIEAKTPTLKPDAGHFEVTTISPDTMERHLKDWTRLFSETFQ